MKGKRRQSQGTVIVKAETWNIRRNSGTAANKYLDEAKALVSALSPEHRETGERILDAALLAGAWAERAKQARWLAVAIWQKRFGELGGRRGGGQGGEGGRPAGFGSISENDLAEMASLSGAELGQAIDNFVSTSARDITHGAVRKALARRNKRQPK